MKININLLPKREKEHSSAFMLASIISLCVIVAGVWLYVQWSGIKEEADVLQQQVVSAKVQAEQSKQNADNTVTSPSPKLEPIVKIVEEQRITTVPVLKRLTSLLPGNGVFQSFSYEESGVIILDIRFDERRDAAYFYSRLMKEAWLTEVTLSTLEAADQQGQKQGVPRYNAHYELTVNKEEARMLEKEGAQ